MDEPKLTLDQAKETVETKTAPRVTERDIKGAIACVDYINGVRGNQHLTICVLTLKNGFSAVGMSAPASVENYDRDVGARYAWDNAFKQLWPLFGFALRERLHWGSERELGPGGEVEQRIRADRVIGEHFDRALAEQAAAHSGGPEG